MSVANGSPNSTLHSVSSVGKLGGKKQVKQYSRWAPHPTGDGVTPYLDVMTVNSAQFPSIIQGTTETDVHSRLLVEPVPVPDMRHCDIKPLLRSEDCPLFYPNGAKNCNLRDTIKGALRASVDGPPIIPAQTLHTESKPTHGSVHSTSLSVASSRNSRMGALRQSGTSSRRSRGGERDQRMMVARTATSTSESNRSRATSVVSSSYRSTSSIGSGRTVDAHTKKLLGTLKANNHKLGNLVMLH